MFSSVRSKPDMSVAITGESSEDREEVHSGSVAIRGESSEDWEEVDSGEEDIGINSESVVDKYPSGETRGEQDVKDVFEIN